MDTDKLAPDEQVEPVRPAAAHFLAQCQADERRKRGRLTIPLGAAPGVGKTYGMFHAARRLKAEGVDVAIGLVETHNRAESIADNVDLHIVAARSEQRAASKS